MFWLLVGYMFLFIHRPFEVWPSLAEMRVELLYALGTAAIWLVAARKSWIPNRMHFAFIAFASAVLLSWMISPWADKGQRAVEDYLKIFFVYVLLVTTLRDERALKRVVVAYVAIMMVYMTHSLAEYVNGRYVFRMGIARMIGVDQSLGDPNSFGATIVYALPFVIPLWMTDRSRRMRFFLASYVALSVMCVALTGSRSSFVGLLLFGFILIMRTRWRGRLMVLSLVLAPVFWALLPGDLQNRFETIINPEVGPANAAASADSRKQGLLIGLQLWENNPLTGCGPGVWRAASGSKLESHNLYGQVLGETGTLGALAFAAIVIGFWINLRFIKKTYRIHPEWGYDFPYQLARAVGLSLLLLLFLGNFGHNLFRYSWLWYGAFLIVAQHCVRQRLVSGVAFNVQPRRQLLWPARAMGQGIA